ncbi:MAG: polysaccharide biosynthesis C-terminal domain-containing protein [Ferruginibacter sp.]
MSSFKLKLLKGLAWRFGYYVSAFILNILIAHYLGASKSGVFYLLLNNLAFVVLVLSVGIDSGIGYFNARKEIGPGQFLSLSFLWVLVAAVILAGIYWAGLYFHFIIASSLTIYGFIYIAFSLLSTFLNAIVFSMGDDKTPSLIFTIVNIILIFLLPGNPLVTKIVSPDLYTKLYLLAAILPAIIFFFILLQRKINFSFTGPGFLLQQKFLRFILQSFLFSLLYTLLLRCDYWVVNYFCSDADLGNYLQTVKLNQLVLLIPALASFTLFPLIVSQVHQQKMVEAKVVTLVKIYFFIGLAICLAVILTGYWMLPVIYGESFSKMYPVFILLSPGILSLAAAYPLNTFFAGKDLIVVNIKAIFFSIIILLLLDFLVIPYYGIYGAALASTAGYGFYFMYLLIKFKKKHPFNIKALFDLRKLIKENHHQFFNIKLQNED